MPLASLPWYDLSEIRAATDALWGRFAQNLRRHGVRDVPAMLNREAHYEQQWSSPDFLFGQACGYDVLLAYPQHLQVVATPHYLAAGCRRCEYSSFVVVRDDAACETLADLRGARCVINTLSSHSGMNILRAMVAPLHCRGRFFSFVQTSGSHEASLAMLMRCEADVAAIDCVTYALLERHRPRSWAGTRVLCQTQHVPAPPFVTAARTSPHVLQRLRRALLETLADPRLASVKEDLLLDDVDFLPLSAYRPIADLEEAARGHDYWEISPLVPAEAAANCAVRAAVR